MTLELFRENGYLQDCGSLVTAIDGNRIVVDQTVFYPEGGGQPGDTGKLICSNGTEIPIEDTRKDRDSG